MSDSSPRSFRKGDVFPEDLVAKPDCPAKGPDLTFQAL